MEGKSPNTHSKVPKDKSVSKSEEAKNRSICRIFQLIIPKGQETEENRNIRPTCPSLSAIRNEPVNPMPRGNSIEIANTAQPSRPSLSQSNYSILRDYLLSKQQADYIAKRSIDSLKSYWHHTNHKAPVVFKKQKLLNYPLTQESFIEEEFPFLLK